MNIFIAKLNFDTQSEDLKELFETFGEVSSAKVIFDHFTGKSKGFAFVEMPNDDEANAAIEKLDDSELHGNALVVKEAKPRASKRSNYSTNYVYNKETGSYSSLDGNDKPGYRDDDRGGYGGGYGGGGRDRGGYGGGGRDRGGYGGCLLYTSPSPRDS